MKHALLILVLALNVISATAQIINGSFEENGQASLNGWNTGCSEATLVPGGAPGAGDWHVAYPMRVFPVGNPWSCASGQFDPIYQELPWLIPSNQVITVGFWYRTSSADQLDYFAGIDCRLARLTNGEYDHSSSTGQGSVCSTEWTYLSVQATAISFMPQNMRVLAFLGFDTISTAVMELDGIEILSVEEQSTSIESIDPTKVLGYYDAANEAVVIARSLSSPLLCFDAAGRNAVLIPSGTWNGSKTFSTASLVPGIYTAVSGSRSLRFVKH